MTTSARRVLDRAMTEAQLQRLVIDTAHAHGWLVAHFRPAKNERGEWATHMQGDPGFPDLVLARRGVVIFAELKAEKGRLSEGQERWLDALDPKDIRPWDRTHEAYVWRPRDIDEVIATLAAE